MLSKTRLGALSGLAAALSMTATPAAAADLPSAPESSSIYAQFDQSRYDGDTDIAERHRRWGRHGWYRHRNRVDAGDVLAGVLIIGGIAAIASAASNNDRRDRERDYRRVRDYDRDYDRRTTRRSTSGSGLDNAVDQCVSRIERDVRVDSVDNVSRTGDGWFVTGSLFNGTGFTCEIDNNGRISDIDYGGFQGSSYEPGAVNRAQGNDTQWSDARYAAARQSVGQSVGSQSPSPSAEQLPAYPGGPLPGEEYPGDIDGDLGG
ncbi:hypothetical protein ACI5KX_07135 [Erythrobacter sp. GH1-10]|uniref:hypothetical protein n=1 Tax=Erythrobacter sp. GH1-10 TaxID=3349334 RepID=UPI003877A2BB